MADTVEATGPLNPVAEAFEKQRADVLAQFSKEAIAAAGQETESAPEPEKAEGGEAVLSQKEIEAEPDSKSEETEAETTTEETETAEGDEKPEDHLGDLREKLDPKLQESINRRIGKEVAKTKAEKEAREAMEVRLAELETKLEEKANEPAPVASSTATPLAHIQTVKQLEAEQQKAEQARELAEDLLVQIEDDPESVEATLKAANIKLAGPDGEDYSVPKMRRWLRETAKNAERVVTRAIPERRKYIQEAEGYTAAMLKVLPELKDKTSPRFQKYQQVLAAYPEIKAKAFYPAAAVFQVLGMERFAELQAEAEKSATPKPKKAVPVKIPAPKATATAPKVDPDTVDRDQQDAILSGNKAARRKLIESIMPKFG